MSQRVAGPLAGIRILDLARLGPGPHSSQILSDLGAEVITVEPPAGPIAETRTAIAETRTAIAETRTAIAETVSGASPGSASGRAGALVMPRGAPIRRNSRSITLNLKQPRGLAVLLELAAGVDVVVEGFRPGVAARLGIDYASLRHCRDDIICVSLSGFGQTGPYAQVAGHDINYQAMAGLLHLTGDADGPPKIPGNAVADNAGGISAALCILAALLARERTGQGQYVDVAMLDTLLTMMLLNLNQYVDSGVSPKRGETLLTGAFCFYNVYECEDGKYLAVGAIEPWFYSNLCRLLGRADLIENQRAGGDVARERIRIFGEIFRTKPRDVWVAELMHADTCVSPVYALDEVAHDPHLRSRGSIVEAPDSDGFARTQVGVLAGFSATPGGIRCPAPAIGADTHAVLGELGYSETEIAALAAAGAF